MANRQGWAAVLCVGLLAGGRAMAEEPRLGWGDQAELSYVLTAGNSESTTLGFKNELRYTWANALFTLKAAAIRAESTTFTRTAVGTPEDFVVDESENSELTAEAYLLSARYDRKVSDFLFWYGGVGWDRNRFSGIDNRTVVEGGLGNIWIDRDDLKFKTTYALTYTDQEDVVEDPEKDGTFAGVRVGWDYLNKFGANTVYQNVLTVDDNLEETSDWRADMLNSLTVSMSQRLALKAGLRWLYDNEPAVTLVPLRGTNPVQLVRAELEELDTIFTTSLVFTW